MKLKNKILLPILTIGTAAAAATPLLVSCGASNGSSVYIPTIPKAIPQSGDDTYKASDVQAIYYQHIKENPEVYAQDLKCHLSSFEERLNFALTGALFEDKDIEHKFNIDFNFNYTLNNLEFGEYTRLNSDSAIIPVSMDINASLHIDSRDDAPYIYLLESPVKTRLGKSGGDETTFSYQHVNLNSIKLHFVDFPVLFDSEYKTPSRSGVDSIIASGWVFESALQELDDELISYLPPWSLTMSVASGYCTCTWQANKNMSFDNFNYVFDNYTTDSEIAGDMQLNWLYLTFGYLLFQMSSYHMSDFKPMP